MPRSILISAVILLIAGCSIGPTSSARPSPATTTSPASTASLSCQDAIASEDSPDSYLSVVFNQVALPTSNAGLCSTIQSTYGSATGRKPAPTRNSPTRTRYARGAGCQEIEPMLTSLASRPACVGRPMAQVP